MKEHQYSEYIVNITILFITGSEKKNRILIPRKCSGSWKAGQGIGYWRIVARKNLVLQETVYMRTMYDKCHSLLFTLRFYYTRVHYNNCRLQIIIFYVLNS